ncbi:hypothetical protein OSTOST_23654, partial [Ostertagia ostertagi]
MIRNFSSVVVNLGNSSFDRWPQNTNVYRVNSIDADYIADVVDNPICCLPRGSYLAIYRIYITVTTTVDPTPYTLTSSFETTAYPATMTVEPTPTSLPEANINNTGCNCHLETVWLDVFLLMDASLSMTPNGIDS